MTAAQATPAADRAEPAVENVRVAVRVAVGSPAEVTPPPPGRGPYLKAITEAGVQGAEVSMDGMGPIHSPPS